jgi:hypothetical protein
MCEHSKQLKYQSGHETKTKEQAVAMGKLRQLIITHAKLS